MLGTGKEMGYPFILHTLSESKISSLLIDSAPSIHKMRRWLLWNLSLGAGLLLGGCGSVYNVSVNSFDDLGSNGLRKYYVLPGNPGVTEDDFEFFEAKDYLGRLLQTKGFQPTETLASAETAIFISYGLGQPQTFTSTYSVPIYGQTSAGGPTNYNIVTYGTNGPQVATGTIWQQPTNGVVGQQTQTTSTTVIPKWVRIEAIDIAEYKRTGHAKSIWVAVAVTSDNSPDLRRELPVLIASARDYIARSSGQVMSFGINDIEVGRRLGISR